MESFDERDEEVAGGRVGISFSRLSLNSRVLQKYFQCTLTVTFIQHHDPISYGP